MLSTTSPFQPGNIVFDVTNAVEVSSGAYVVGLSAWGQPFLGGTLVPSPDILLPLITDSAGDSTLSVLLPAELPQGFTGYVQAWINDPLTPGGMSATNSLRGLLY